MEVRQDELRRSSAGAGSRARAGRAGWYTLARPQALRLAARPDRAVAAVHLLGAGRSDRSRCLLVLRPCLDLRDISPARSLGRIGCFQSAGLGDQMARAGSLLPLVHL